MLEFDRVFHILLHGLALTTFIGFIQLMERSVFVSPRGYEPFSEGDVVDSVHVNETVLAQLYSVQL